MVSGDSITTVMKLEQVGVAHHESQRRHCCRHSVDLGGLLKE